MVQLRPWSQKARVSFPFLWLGVQDMLSKTDTAGCDVLMLVLDPLVSNYVKPDVKGNRAKAVQRQNREDR